MLMDKTPRRETTVHAPDQLVSDTYTITKGRRFARPASTQEADNFQGLYHKRTKQLQEVTRTLVDLNNARTRHPQLFVTVD